MQRKTPSRVASEFPDVIVTAGHMCAVFRKSLPKPKPDFPQEFMELMPVVDIDVLQSETLQAKDLVERLGLQLERRFKLVEFLTQDREFTDQSRNNQLFAAYVCLQSFPALLFADMRDISDECVSVFVKGMSLAERYVPETIDLIFRSFYYFYHRLIAAENCIGLISAADEFFELFGQHKVPKYYVPEFIDVTVSVLKMSGADKFDAGCRHLELMSQQLSEQPLHTPENMQAVDAALEMAAGIAVREAETGDGMSKAAVTAVRFGVELSRLTSEPFLQVMPYFSRIIEVPKITEMNGVSWNVAPMEPFSIEGKELKPTEVVVKTDGVHVPDVQSFIELLNDHPMTQLVNSLSLISKPAQFTLFSYLLKHAMDVTASGDLNFWAFIMLYMYTQDIEDVYKTASFINEVHGYSLFFCDSLFKVTGSIFDSNVPVVVRLRKFAADAFTKLFSKVNDDKMLDYFGQGMELIAEYPPVFAEFFYFSFDLLKQHWSEAVFKSLCQGLTYIQYAVRYDYRHAREAAALAIKVLDDLLKLDSFLGAVVGSIAASKMLINLMADSCFSDIGEGFLRVAFDFTRKSPDTTLSSGLTTALAQALDENKQAIKILGMVREILKESTRAYIVEICKSPLFSSIQSYVANTAESDSLVIPMEILKYSTLAEIYKDVHLEWCGVAHRIENLEITEEIYNIILSILAGSWENPTGVNNRDAACFVPSLLVSNRALDFVKALLTWVSVDSVQCLHLYEFNMMSVFVNFLNTNDCGNDIYDTVMMIVARILSFVCNRITFDQFFNLFKPLNGYQNPHTQQLCQYFVSAMIDDPNNQQHVSRFLTGTSFVFLPRLPADLLANGCSFIFNLCLMEPKGSFCLLSMSAGEKQLMVNLGDGSIVVKSNTLANEIIIPFTYPANEWFTLAISCEHMSLWKLYLNGVLVGEGRSKATPWTAGAEKLILFRPASVLANENLAHCEGSLGDFWILKGKITNAHNVAVRNADFQKLGNEKSLVGWYSPKATQGNRMKNLCAMKSDFAIFDLTVLPYMNTFSRLFEKCNGLHHVLSLFAHLELPVKEGQTNPVPDLLGLVQFVLEFSQEVQRQMLDVDGFKVIAFYLSKVDPAMLDLLAWKKVMMIEYSLSNDDLRFAFFRDLLLSVPGWLLGPRKVVVKCLKRWSDMVEHQREFFMKCVNLPSLLCAACDKLCMQTIETKEKDQWFRLLGSVSNSFGEKELKILGQLIIKSFDKPDVCFNLLNLLADIPLDRGDTFKGILYQLTNSDIIFQSNCALVLMRVLSLCGQDDQDLVLKVLLRRINQATSGPSQQDADLIRVFANALVKQTDLSLDDLCCLKDVDTCDEQMLPFLLVYSWSCESEQRVVVGNLLNTIARAPACCGLANKINPLTLLILCSYASLVDSLVSNFLGALLAANVTLIDRCFDIIDFISYATGTNQFEFSLNLASHILEHVTPRKGAKEIDGLIESMVSFLLTQRKMCHEGRDVSCELSTIIQAISTYKPVSLHFPGKLAPSFSQIALKLMNFFYNNAISLSSREKLMGILYLLCDKEMNLITDVCPLLDHAAKLFDMSSRTMGPLINQVKGRLEQYSGATVFCSRLASIGERTPIDDTDMIEVFGEWLLPATDIVTEIDKVVHTESNVSGPQESGLDDISNLHKELRADYLHECSECAHAVAANLCLSSQQGPRKRWINIDYCFRPVVFSCAERQRAHKVSLSSQPFWTCPCERVTFNSRKKGILSLTRAEIAFEHDNKLLVIPGQNVLCLFSNWHLHMPNSFTLITCNSQCYLFTVTGVSTVDVFAKLQDVSLPNCVFIERCSPPLALEKLGITHKWRKRAISNFEYLMWLNVLSGRTFLDAESYPIFPALFSTGDNGERKERNLAVNISDLRATTTQTRETPARDESRPYRFDQTYLTPRVIRSLLKALNHRETAAHQSPAEILKQLDPASELPPEFFLLPEAFEGLELPPWCKSPVDLVRQHAQALESPQVTDALPKWIDMIWGTGRNDPSNLYDPRLYPNVWDQRIGESPEIEQLLMTNGQIPQQLFTEAHPLRKTSKSEVEVMTSSPSKIVAFAASGTNRKSLKILTAHKSEMIYTNQFPSSVVPLEHVNIKWVSHIKFASNMSIVYSQFTSNSFSFVNAKTKEIVHPRDSDLQPSSIALLAVGESAVVSGANDSSVYAWSYDMRLTGRLLVHEEPLTVLDVVDGLHAVVSGDESGKVLLSMLPELSVFTILETGVRPQAVVYAKEVGILVVFGENSMKSYTVNGTLVAEKPLMWQDTCVCALLDCVAIANRDEIVLHDPFTLEPVKSIYKHPSRITAMVYHAPLRRILLTTEDNQIVMVYVA